jgi:hypothetical protein
MTNQVLRHNLTFSFLVWFVAVPTGMLLAAPRMYDLFVVSERTQSAAMATSDLTQKEVGNDLKKAGKGSEIPINLVKANRCIPVILTESGNDPAFTDGVTVKYSAGGQPVPPGTYVCSRGGHSARVGLNGEATETEFTPLETMPDYQAQFDLLLKIQGRESLN